VGWLLVSTLSTYAQESPGFEKIREEDFSELDVVRRFKMVCFRFLRELPRYLSPRLSSFRRRFRLVISKKKVPLKE